MSACKRKLFTVYLWYWFLVGMPSLILEVAGTPFRRGFFCDDESISHPYHEDTITMFTVAFVGICLPLGTVCNTFSPFESSFDSISPSYSERFGNFQVRSSQTPGYGNLANVRILILKWNKVDFSCQLAMSVWCKITWHWPVTST